MSDTSRQVLWLIRKSRLSTAGLVIVVGFVIVGLLAPYIVPYPEDARGESYNIERRFQPPSWEHPFGTDEYGRDVFSRVLMGARYSLIIAVGVVGLALLIGIPVGLVAGYVGGRLGSLLMRVTDMFLAFPPLLLAIALAATLGRGLFNTIIALSISWWPWYARLLYVKVTSVKAMPFVDSARLLGLGRLAIMFRHVLPNSLTPVTVQAALDMGSAILEAAGLSFLGVGVDPSIPEWGLLVTEGWASISRAWWVSLFPGLAILVTVLGFNLLADALRESLDPRTRRIAFTRRILG